MDIPYDKIMETYHGSHLYGLDTPDSDVDIKGVFMPNMDEVLLGKGPKQIRHSTGEAHQKNTSEDEDYVYFSLPDFIKLACDGETIALDMLHAPYSSFGEFARHDVYGVTETTHVWDAIRLNRWRFYTKNMKAFLGYARKQAAKYGTKGSRLGCLEEVVTVIKGMSTVHHEPVRAHGDNLEHIEYNSIDTCLMHIQKQLPVNQFCRFVWNKPDKQGQCFYEVLGSKYQTSIKLEEFQTLMQAKWDSYGDRAKQAKDNKGIDWKAISHAMRAAYQLKAIYETGTITYPLPQRDILLRVKKGEMDFNEEAAPLLEALIAEVELLAAKSDYPDKVDTEWWDTFLLNLYYEQLQDEVA